VVRPAAPCWFAREAPVEAAGRAPAGGLDSRLGAARFGGTYAFGMGRRAQRVIRLRVPEAVAR